jgi:hypothetical protein
VIFCKSFARYKLTIFCVLLSAYITAYAEEEALVVGYPEVWGKLSLVGVNNSECPDLSGIYSIDGTGYEEFRSVPSAASMNGTLKVKVGDILGFRKSTSNNNASLYQKNTILISQSVNELSISIPSSVSNEKNDNYLFKMDAKDFDCKSNWVSFKETTESIGAESSHNNFREVMRMSKLADGSLIFFIDKYVKQTSLWYLGLGDYENYSKLYVKYKVNIKKLD